MSNPYEVKPAAVAFARSLGWPRDCSSRIQRMARRSAPYSGPGGNRRFHDFVLQVRDGVVESMSRLETN